MEGSRPMCNTYLTSARAEPEAPWSSRNSRCRRDGQVRSLWWRRDSMVSANRRGTLQCGLDIEVFLADKGG